jgi:glycosyltransferase involved in cell wall biosynthesis
MLSIVIPVHNGAATLGEQLDALLPQHCPIDWEVLVVDNGSTDATRELVERYRATHDRVRIVSAPDRHNLSYVRNVGVEEAGGDLIAFCDDDDIVGPRWVEAMAHALLEPPHVASRLVYHRLNSPEAMTGRRRFQSDTLETFLGYPIAQGPCGVQRWLWDALGGNDESLSYSGEDFDFSIRAQRELGVSPVLAPDADYHYRTRTSPRALFRQSRRYGRSHVTLYHRHGRGRIDRAGELRRAAHDWWYIASRAPFAAVGRNRSAWAWRTGLRCGRAEQCLRERVLFP